MSYFANRWQRIGTRLYLALGFAVALTLVSSAVGVYYFEASGDLNHRVSSESVPTLEASWAAAREADGLRHLGIELISGYGGGSSSRDERKDAVGATLNRLTASLARANGVPALQPHAGAVHDAALDLATVIDRIDANRDAARDADAVAADFQARLEGLAVSDGSSAAAVETLEKTLQAENQAVLDSVWDEFAAHAQAGIDPAVRALAEGDGVFMVRGQQLALDAQSAELAAEFDQGESILQNAVAGLLEGARQESELALASAVRSFDQGRVLLAVISVASVVAATLAAWLWVGNGLVRRLSRLSERMRGMAGGDLETPVPEVGRDEIGQLADALEVFREHALEVQRLNLVEKLYKELQEANAELQRMQDRLVAQEKLAALGQLVSGVAHEISNPLNFVKNFSEGANELYSELSEMLDNYREAMDSEDVALMDDITQEMTDSLGRVIANGGRALAIVERMRGLGVVGGEPVPADLNPILRHAVQVGCDSFQEEWPDFPIQPVFELDDSLGQVSLVGTDFNEAMVNLVSNACFAMRQKRDDAGDGYQPALKVSSSRVDGTVEVRVRDNGPGIADGIIGQIFNPFYTTREGAFGAGLGLTIAADVARRAGGDLTVDTVPGEYAEFTLSLPAGSDAGSLAPDYDGDC